MESRMSAAKLLVTLLALAGSPKGTLAAPADRTAETLAKGFVNPPDSARPWVYWFWSDGNLTREGVTADLEAMRRAGVGGVLIMEVDQGIPKGPVRFAGAAWREMFRHVVAEAKRLGIEVDMNNDAGWCGSGGPWVTPQHAMQKLVWTETPLEGPRHVASVLPQPEAVAGHYRDVAVLAFPTPAGEAGGKPPYRIDQVQGKTALVRAGVAAPAQYASVPADQAVARDKIVDLTAGLDKSGRLTWDVPKGRWTVLRLGHTPTGANNAPSPAEGRGLECDKLSKAAMDEHFAGLIGKLVSDVGPAAGKTLTYTHIDSWEVHSQNWTPLLRDEFRKRRGYDPLGYLPAMTGRVVDSLEASERFLWDLRKTISELLNENYAGHLAELAHKHGMLLSIEAYGDGPFDDLSYAGRADSPMGEFWVGGGALDTLKAMASAAHTYGRNVVGAEAFTASTEVGKWLNHPYSLKALGDTAFCEGINRFVVHRYAMQPWLNRKPGMTMGPWGVHYERTNTWWAQSLGWHEYLARCQYLLRQGLFVADLCYLQTEGAPNGMGFAPRCAYGFDACTPEAVMTRMKVQDGRLVLPDGMSYRLLALPPSPTMTPELLAKLKELVEAGATVVGTPPVKSPSLAGYPQCDQQVGKLAAELWGDGDTKSPGQHVRGKGKVIWGKAPDKVLADMGVPPDFAPSTGGLRYLHRRTDGAEIYFVANPTDQALTAPCVFRVQGRRPEFWRPDAGTIEPALIYEETKGGTRVPVRLDPRGSVFVVFRAGAAPDGGRVAALTRDGKDVLTPAGGTGMGWQAPDNNRGIVNTFAMAAWVKPSADTPLADKEVDEGIVDFGAARNDVVYPPPLHEVYAPSPGQYVVGEAGAGFSVGHNGAVVYEHGDSYFAPLLIYRGPIKGWTHVAVVYTQGRPALFLNGKPIAQGLGSKRTVHPGVGVLHSRGVAPFRGQVSALRQFDKALTEAQIAKLMGEGPPKADVFQAPPPDLLGGPDGAPVLRAWEPGRYVIRTADGKARQLDVPPLPAPIEVAGAWDLAFPSGWGAPPRVSLDKLIPWSDHPEAGVKYFSGTATYTRTLHVPPAMLEKGRRAFLDLGSVQVIAEVRLNGKDLGVLWKPPFRVDITDAAKAGDNTLEVKLTNLWPNRLIGDEQLPEDCKRHPGGNLVAWPKWLLEGKPSPTGRFTFATWRHWTKDSPLLESGLLGPVRIMAAQVIANE